MLIICAPLCQACLKVEGGQFQHVLMCSKVFNKTVNVDSMDGLLVISDSMLISTCFLNYSIFARGNTFGEIVKSWNTGSIYEMLCCYNTGLLIFLQQKSVSNIGLE